MLRKTISILVIIILGTIAAQQILKAVLPLIPLLIILGLAVTVGGGWFQKKRNHW